MTDTTGTKQLAGGTVPAAEATGRSRGADSILDALWHFLTSMKFALILILVLAALTLVGTLLMQMSPAVADDPQARAEWLSSVRPRYGAWTDPLAALGFFNMFGSFLFRLTAGLLAASTIACTLQRIPGTWRTQTRPNVAVGAGFFEHAPQHEAMTFHKAPAAVLESTEAVLRRRHFRTIVADDGTVHLYADRNRWAPWGGLIAHFSIVVIMAGVLVGSQFGYRDSQFMIAEGQTSSVPTKAGLSITLNSFSDKYDPSTGQPIDYVSDVTLSRGGQVVAQHLVRVNEPLRFEDISFYQAFFGPAAILTVKDAAGQTVFDGGVPLAYTSNNGGNKVGTFTIPDKNVTVWVVETTGVDDPSVKPGQIGIELYDGTTGNAITQQSIDQGKATDVNGLTYTFEREAKFTGLSIAKDPGTPLVWLGSFLLVVGFVIRLFVPYRRIWGRLTARPDGGSSLSIATVGRHDSGLDAEFTAIVTDIRQAVVGQAQS